MQLTLEKAGCRRQRRHVTGLQRRPVFLLVVIARKHPTAYKLYVYMYIYKLRHVTQLETREGNEGRKYDKELERHRVIEKKSIKKRKYDKDRETQRLQSKESKVSNV
jgi:hypothetical protein